MSNFEETRMKHYEECLYCRPKVLEPPKCPDCGEPMRFTDYRQEGKEEASWLTAAWYECENRAAHHYKLIWYVGMPPCYWEHWEEDHKEPTKEPDE